MTALNPYQPPAHDVGPAAVEAPSGVPRGLLRQSQLLGVFVLLLLAVGGYQVLKARLAMSYDQLAPISYVLLLLTHFVTMQVAVVPAIVAVAGPVHLARLSGGAQRVTIVPGVIGALACVAAALFGFNESLWTAQPATTEAIFYGLLAASAVGAGGQIASSWTSGARVGGGEWVIGCYGGAVVIQLVVLAHHAVPTVLGPWAPFGSPPDDLAWANALAALALFSLLRSKPSAPLSILRWLGLLPALVSFVLLRVALSLVGPDLQMHDTYVEVASLHAGGTVALLGVLGFLRFVSCEERAGGVQLLGVAGATLASLGLNATTWSMFALGRAGMPRRYSQFPAELVPAHRLVTWAALAAGLGIALFVVAGLFSRRDGTSEPEATPAAT